jgi:preprotein translocase subunit YajC
VQRVSGLEQLLPFVLIFVVFWLLLIRPQRKRQQELVRTQGSVVVGDEVMLGAGIAGRVAEAGEEFLQLEIAPGVQMKVARQAVVKVLTEEPAVDPGDDWSDRPDAP